jgi:hypothetical protein
MTEQLNFEVKIERYELGYRAVAGTATANFRLPFSESELEKVLPMFKRYAILVGVCLLPFLVAS